MDTPQPVEYNMPQQGTEFAGFEPNDLPGNDPGSGGFDGFAAPGAEGVALAPPPSTAETPAAPTEATPADSSAPAETPAEAKPEEKPAAEAETPAPEVDAELVDLRAFQEALPEGMTLEDAHGAVMVGVHVAGLLERGPEGYQQAIAEIHEMAAANGIELPSAPSTAPATAPTLEALPGIDVEELTDNEKALYGLIQRERADREAERAHYAKLRDEIKDGVKKLEGRASQAEALVSAPDRVKAETGLELRPMQIKAAIAKTGIDDPVKAVLVHYAKMMQQQPAANPAASVEDLGGQDARTLTVDPSKLSVAELIKVAKENPELLRDYQPAFAR